MNDQENNIYNKLVLQKLKTEMEILTNRQENFRSSIDTIDKEIKQLLDNKSIPEILRREVLSEWKKQCQKISILYRTFGRKKNRRNQKHF